MDPEEFMEVQPVSLNSLILHPRTELALEGEPFPINIRKLFQCNMHNLQRECIKPLSSSELLKTMCAVSSISLTASLSLDFFI